MGKAVVGIFDSSSEAQQAIRNLENIGITRDHVDITERSGIEPEREHRDEGLAESISHFFSNLFGNDEEEARTYSEVANRGCTVTVFADSDQEAENAADILDDCGAIDVVERANQYRSGMTGSAGTQGSMGASGVTGTTGNTSGMGARGGESPDSGSISGGAHMERDRMQDDLGRRMEGTSGDSSATRPSGMSDRNIGMDSPGTGVPDQWSNQQRTGSGATGNTSSLGDDFSGDLNRPTGSERSDDNMRAGNEWFDDLSTSRGITDPGSAPSGDDTRKPGELNTGVPNQPMGTSGPRSGSGDMGSSASDESMTRTNSRIRRSRIFETPDDIRNRGGRTHPSAANRNTTGDINPLNQQNPGSTGYNPNL